MKKIKIIASATVAAAYGYYLYQEVKAARRVNAAWEEVGNRFAKMEVPEVDLDDIRKQWAEGPGAALAESHARMMDELNLSGKRLKETLDNTREQLHLGEHSKFQYIDGQKVYVVEFDKMPVLPIIDLDPELQPYARALTFAIQDGVVTKPGKYAVQVDPAGVYQVFAVQE